MSLRTLEGVGLTAYLYGVRIYIIPYRLLAKMGVDRHLPFTTIVKRESQSANGADYSVVSTPYKCTSVLVHRHGT